MAVDCRRQPRAPRQPCQTPAGLACRRRCPGVRLCRRLASRGRRQGHRSIGSQHPRTPRPSRLAWDERARRTGRGQAFGLKPPRFGHGDRSDYSSLHCLHSVLQPPVRCPPEKCEPQCRQRASGMLEPTSKAEWRSLLLLRTLKDRHDRTSPQLMNAGSVLIPKTAQFCDRPNQPPQLSGLPNTCTRVQPPSSRKANLLSFQFSSRQPMKSLSSQCSRWLATTHMDAVTSIRPYLSTTRNTGNRLAKGGWLRKTYGRPVGRSSSKADGPNALLASVVVASEGVTFHVVPHFAEGLCRAMESSLQSTPLLPSPKATNRQGEIGGRDGVSRYEYAQRPQVELIECFNLA